MSVSELAVEELNSKQGYAYENDDTTATFKEIVPGKIWFYFGKEDENGGPYYGFWAEDTVSDAVKHNLRVVLGGFVFQNDGDVEEEGPVIYRTMEITSEAGEATIAKGIIAKMKKLETGWQEMLEAAI
jgi:hypothetical protein